MHLSLVDILIICLFLAVSFTVGMLFSRRGSHSINDYFISGRRLPWWLAGMSMTATAFAIDTPLGITGLIAGNGLQGVWYAWAFILGGAGAFGAMIFARFLRRSRVVTLAELIEVRYSGPEARVLRIVKAGYFGVLANAMTLGWVIKAVFTVCEAVFPAWNAHLVLGGIVLFTLLYTTFSGMWGIAATDCLQYIISTVGSVVLAVVAFSYIGGTEGIIEGFSLRYGTAEAIDRLSFLPRFGTDFFVTFVVFLTLKWWGDMPPAITQRVLSSKNETHASWAVLFFATVHFALNYWPMIIVALVSLVLFPDLVHAEQGYALCMVRLLPSGLLGLMLAAMIAAFMSTIDTHINMGASYIVKDWYQRFLVRKASARHYVRVARCSTVLMLGIAVVIAYNIESVKDAWYWISLLFSGYGFVAVARWFWWRINAWSEIAAMAAGLTGSVVVREVCAPRFEFFSVYGRQFLIVFLFTTVSWVCTTLLTRPSDMKTLHTFCKLVKPWPLLWKPVQRACPNIEWSRGMGWAVLRFLLGAGFIFSLCFSVGNMLLGSVSTGMVLAGSWVVCGVSLFLVWRR